MATLKQPAGVRQKLPVTLAAAVALVVLSGCVGLNAVSELSPGRAAEHGGRVVVIGVERSGADQRPLAVSLDEYDPETGDIGGCIRHDTIRPRLEAGESFALRAFSVPAGSYASGILDRMPGAYVAVEEPGLYYLGDFAIPPGEGWLRDDWRIGRAGAMLGIDPRRLSLPEVRPLAAIPRLFMCTP